LLAWYVSAESEVDAVEMHEPYTYLNGLHVADLEDLLEDIKVYKELENNENFPYWSDITTIVIDELEKLRRAEGTTAGENGDMPRRDGIHHAVAQDVTQVRSRSITFEEWKFLSSCFRYSKVKPVPNWKLWKNRSRRKFKAATTESMSDIGNRYCLN
jgi:hypothetical protein